MSLGIPIRLPADSDIFSKMLIFLSALVARIVRFITWLGTDW